MRAQAAITAQAFHEPKGLEGLLKPAKKQRLDAPDDEPGGFEHDNWWPGKVDEPATM